MIRMIVRVEDEKTGKMIGSEIVVPLEIDPTTFRDMTAPTIEVMGGIAVERHWGSHMKNLFAAAAVKAFISLRHAVRAHFQSLESVGA